MTENRRDMRHLLLFALPLLIAALSAQHAFAGAPGIEDSVTGAEPEIPRLDDAAGKRESWASGDRGGYFESLSLHYELDGLALAAGKYTPSFTVSGELAPLSFAAAIAEQHDQQGRVGIGAAWNIGGAGRHALSLDSYFLESTLLNAAAWRNEAAWQSENETAAAPPETSNISDLRQVSAALNGEITTPLDRLSYHIAARYQEWDKESAIQEFGYVAALHGNIALAGGAVFDPVVEFVYLEDGGDAGLEQQFLTFGATGYLGQWNLSLTFSGRDSTPHDPAAATEKQRLRQLLLRYSFQDGTTVDFGHRREGRGGAVTNNISFRVAIPF